MALGAVGAELLEHAPLAVLDLIIIVRPVLVLRRRPALTTIPLNMLLPPDKSGMVALGPRRAVLYIAAA